MGLDASVQIRGYRPEAAAAFPSVTGTCATFGVTK
jgi:hypothetical protein